MDLLVAIILGGILLPIVVNLISNELYDRAPSFARWLINRAARQLPQCEREQRREEWLAHLDHSEGKLGQVRHAIGCVIAGTQLVAGPIPLRGRIVKRAIDLLIALLGLPVVTIIIVCGAALMQLQSPGPIFVVQERVGRRNTHFRLLRLRTMHVGQVDTYKHDGNDPRIPPIGSWLRRWNLDVLPTLLNVIKGDMSWVGPRPNPPERERKLQESFPELSIRNEVTPGVVSLSQIPSILRELNLDGWEVARADAAYASSWSLALDVKILISIVAKDFRTGQKDADP